MPSSKLEYLPNSTVRAYRENEEHRRSTFTTRGLNIATDILSKLYFIMITGGNQIQCIFCGFIADNPSNVNSLTREHDTRFPNCQRPKSAPVRPARFNINDYNVAEKDPGPIEETPIIKDYEWRLNSFRGQWNVNFIKVEDLARANFHFVRQPDSVQCHSCTVVLNGWEYGDVPMEEHKRHSKFCPFILWESDKEDIPIPTSSGENIPNIAYSDYDDRLKTFNNWPGYHDFRAMAKTGFYHIGNGNTKCFKCNMILTKWLEKDVPEIEHKAWKPDCSMIKDIPIRDICSSFAVECVICIDKDVETIFMPCRHAVTCKACSQRIRNRSCPTCGEQIKIIYDY